jgi:membrane associated rhomboid family serine protease
MKRTQPLILVVIGCIALMSVARNPRFEAFHTVDVLGLVASGACFGMALALIFRMLHIGQFK